MSKFLPYSCQSISESDVAAVTAALRSDFLTTGPRINEFEQQFAAYVGARYAVAVSNGTAALHLAVLALELEPRTVGITSTNSFVASSNALLYGGLEVSFADIDRSSGNLSVESVLQVLNQNTSVMIPVHFAGIPCDMPALQEFAKKHKLACIEDASHALGSRYACGASVGSCTYSDLTTFSFHAVKTITTGEGGMITTNSKALYDRLNKLRTHGITRNPDVFVHKQAAFDETAQVNPWYYEMQCLGFNYRLTDFQAALGISQLARLDEMQDRRRELYQRYRLAFADNSIVRMFAAIHDERSCYHLCVLQIDFKALKSSRSCFMNMLKAQGIGTQVHYIPIHLQPFYQARQASMENSFPEALKYYEQCLSIPLYPDLSFEDQDRVIDSIQRATRNG